MFAKKALQEQAIFSSRLIYDLFVSFPLTPHLRCLAVSWRLEPYCCVICSEHLHHLHLTVTTVCSQLQGLLQPVPT